MTALLPCPFCGGEAAVRFVIQGAFVCCAECGVAQRSQENSREAVAAWNRRAAPASPRSLGVSQDEPPPPAEPPVEGWKPTHVHADGGEYRFIRHMDGRVDQHESWCAGVLYEGADGRFWWTGNDRWFDRFTLLPSPPLSAKDTSERNDLAGDDDKAKPSTSLGGDSRASVASSSLPDGRSDPQRKSEGEG